MAHDKPDIHVCKLGAAFDPARNLSLRHAQTVHSTVELDNGRKPSPQIASMHRPGKALIERVENRNESGFRTVGLTAAWKTVQNINR